jgi:hypothetical protein
MVDNILFESHISHSVKILNKLGLQLKMQGNKISNIKF